MLYFLLPFIFASLIFVIIYIKTKEKTDTVFFDEQISEHRTASFRQALKKVKKISTEHKKKYEDTCSKEVYKRIKRQYRSYNKNHKKLNDSFNNYEELIPGCKWLLDNSYVVKREIKMLSDSMRKSSFKNLKSVINYNSLQVPRIADFLNEFLSYENYYFSEEKLLAAIETYQENDPFDIKELWIIPLILRVIYIERINNAQKEIINQIGARKKADDIFDQILEENSSTKRIIKSLITEMKNSKTKERRELDFCAQIILRLKERGVDNKKQLEEILKVMKCSVKKYDRIIKEEAILQGRLETNISILIRSLIAVSELNWDDMFERVCVVDEILSKEKVNIYSKMDFDTKDDYRKEVEKFSKSTGLYEYEIANLIVEKTEGKTGKEEHVGYYLLDDGRNEMIVDLDIENGIKRKTDLFFRRNKGTIYFIFLYFLSLALSGAIAYYTYTINNSIIKTIVAFVITLIPAYSLVLPIINYIFLKIVIPKPPASMEYKKTVGKENRTLVTYPVLIDSKNDIDKYVQKLELTYLANKDKNIDFAILGDFTDSKTKETKKDIKLIGYAKKKIIELNLKYKVVDASKFIYMNRYRKWNPKENIWMGWERKRGKIEELNRLLMGDENTSYDTIVGELNLENKFKYVITLDGDTELSIDNAKKLISIMAHPLNKPELNDSRTRVVKGYGIVQPRVNIRLKDNLKNVFSRLFVGETGIDPYTNAVSDIYQDVFREGIFTGKGIYDVKIFYELLNNRIKENSILSHDLLEGSITRCALASKIQIFDAYPSNVISYFRREHRWIRGDWQLLKWITKKHKQINFVSRWKMIANLIRSITPVFELIFIILAILYFDYPIYIWLGFLFLSTILPIILKIKSSFDLRHKNLGIIYRIKDLSIDVLKTITKSLVMTSLLPYRMYLCLDAVFRTLFRVYISKNNLLQWKSFETIEKNNGYINILDYIREMLYPLIVTIGLIVVAIIIKCDEMFILSLVFLLSPLVAYSMSIKLKDKDVDLSKEKKDYLKKIARDTYLFFDIFHKREFNYLPPDNFQVFKNEKVAKRTSPTNIGLYLLSLLSAWDFGFVSGTELLNKCQKTIETILKLEKWQGNLYNWYDIESARPLNPRYISSVDSGNFIAFLIAFKNGIEDIRGKHIINNIDIDYIKEILGELGINENQINRLNDVDIINKLKDIIYTLEENSSIYKDKDFYNYVINLLKGFIKDMNNISKEKYEGQINNIAKNIDVIINNTNFNQLYNKKRKLFYIGYNTEIYKADDSYYDLIASEARLTSYLAIAKNQVGKKHWYKLRRPLVLTKNKPTLLSWSGTMFEYFMPHLVLNYSDKTIFGQTLKNVIKVQRRYAKKKNVPFGISESAFFRFDENLNYQYRAFGIPDLGFRSDLHEYLVISPYSSIIAIEKETLSVIRNLKNLEKIGAYGKYGFYESVDYMVSKITEFQKPNIVQTYMAHHQGMILVSINNLLNQNIIRKRFHKEPAIKAYEVLLDENRILGQIIREKKELLSARKEYEEENKEPRIINSTKLKYPVVNIMSNDSYQIMITSDGAGYSKYDQKMINNWNDDWLNGINGHYIYIKDLTNNVLYSATYLPTMKEPDDYEVKFTPAKCEFSRIDNNLKTNLELFLSPEENVEIRRLSIKNLDMHDFIELEITNFIDLVLNEYEAFSSHSTFNKLFIETRYDEINNIIIAKRRKRTENEEDLYLGFTTYLESEIVYNYQYETDRSIFIGRGRSLENPISVTDSLTLSKKTGEVVDPCISTRCRIQLGNLSTKKISYITCIGEDPEMIVDTLNRYKNTELIEETKKLSYFENRLEMSYLGLNNSKVNAILDISVNAIYNTNFFNINIRKEGVNNLKQENLWKFGISGDFPILLIIIKSENDLPSLKDAVSIYEYLRRNQTVIDLVVINKKYETYNRELTNIINDYLNDIKTYKSYKGKKNIFQLEKDDVNFEELVFLKEISCILIENNERIMADKRTQLREEFEIAEAIEVGNSYGEESYPNNDVVFKKTIMKNQYGGFSKDEKEYIIQLKDFETTPAPWTNILSNEKFGCLVSESGLGYTYNRNSRENKLTKWENDPVIDKIPEVIYIKDDTSKEIFTITPRPLRDKGKYQITHGFGYTKYEHNDLGLVCSQTVFVPQDDSIKCVILSFENISQIPKTIEVSYVLNWVLSVYPNNSVNKFIEAEHIDDYNILTARNTYSSNYTDIAFIYSLSEIKDFSMNKIEIYGKKEKGYPDALLKGKLSSKSLLRDKSSLMIRTKKEIDIFQKVDFAFIIGQEKDNESIKRIAEKYNKIEKIKTEFVNTKEYWSEKLSKIKIMTPNAKMNCMVNGWLLYQTIACRLFARSAYYQSGGAFGFRDQLQDSLALLYIEPEITKDIIIKAAKRQFKEGDVMHWWHEDTNYGIRTKISDDLLWLPYAVFEYIEKTGDYNILEEKTAYLLWERLESNEYEKYGKPAVSNYKDTIYNHCKKAIEHAYVLGKHNLPLMGTGDWNDGMNMIGKNQKGESIWLGWFLYDVVQKFIKIAKKKNDISFVEEYKEKNIRLKDNLDKQGWDDNWYKRAFFDNGQAVGSNNNLECKIDLISQAWSVISKAGNKEKSKAAIDAAMKHLVINREKMILILTPPFNRSKPNPGYIQGYIEGVRENGGQYTHGAIWMVIAQSMLKNEKYAYKYYDYLNPITHTEKDELLWKYKLEPYVMAADVYYNDTNKGRGGWSWYTGSAGWMYRTCIENLLGLKKKGNKLYFNTLKNKNWRGFKVSYKYLETLYNIELIFIRNIEKSRIVVEGVEIENNYLLLTNDSKTHNVKVYL